MKGNKPGQGKIKMGLLQKNNPVKSILRVNGYSPTTSNSRSTTISL